MGTFFGIGVGPGERGLIPVSAWEALQRCEVIFVPRAESMAGSVARSSLPPHSLPDERFHEIEFRMDPDRTVLRAHYAALAERIARELRAGRDVAYLTLGDPLTYSTYNYTLAALRDCLPHLRYRTFPGVTSYAALAAATDWPLGEGKERVLILPCPDHPDELRRAIAENDVVVLMKIGGRLAIVLEVLRELGIASHCAFGRRVGMPEADIWRHAGELTASPAATGSGYLATMLIRKTSPQKRHSSRT
ncbi:MAG: precorrin-2 C(20)-methyltransferase [Verrucomicrobia bacterium]|nr:precorrin-2 C(20)-methyltransferase [Verrucomicrobiota bacterium]